MANDQSDNKIVITHEDTEAARVVAVTHQMREAEQYALVREVGTANSSAAKGNLTFLAIAIMAGGGIAGGIVAFLMYKLSDAIVDWDSASVWVSTLSFTFILAFFIGLTLIAVDAATERNLSKFGKAVAIGVPVAIVSGLIFGAIAQAVYSAWTTAIYNAGQTQVENGYILSEEQFWDYVIARLHWSRGVAWSLLGIAVGVTIGSASRSLRRTLVTCAGGLVGGFLGGFIFDFLPGEGLAQISGIAMTGLLIGLAMSLLEQAAKTRWIEIVSGGMAGKQFILYKTDLTIGSSPRADITLIKDPAIPDLAARLTIRGSQAVLESLNAAVPVAVNGQISNRVVLADGNQLTFGSSVIRYRERSSAGQAPTGGPVRLS